MTHVQVAGGWWLGQGSFYQPWTMSPGVRVESELERSLSEGRRGAARQDAQDDYSYCYPSNHSAVISDA